MRRAVLWLGLFPCCCLLACATAPQHGQLDPLVEQISIQAAYKKTPGSAPIKAPGDIVLDEIPLKTPLEQAHAIMKRHGFSCWSNVPDDRGPCLHCTAYIRKNQYYADRVVVKLFYMDRRVINVVVTVDRNVWHMF